jgi:acyl carrier protein
MPIQDVGPDICEKQFRAKVKGLYVLEKVLEGMDIDFCLLTSSLSSIIGGIGYSAYAAANIFMDAFVHRHNQSHSVTWVSVDWDAWQLKDESGQTISESNVTESSIKANEGGEALQRILSQDLGDQIVVSTTDLQTRIDKWVKLESLKEPESTGQETTAQLYTRPDLLSAYVAPGNPTEQTVADIWQQMLRVEKVGIHDNFIELGGHSLLATQVITRLRKAFPVELSVANLFGNPTVHSLSKFILEQDNKGTSFQESKSRGQKRKERLLRRNA